MIHVYVSLEKNTNLLSNQMRPLTHRHFLQVAVVIADGQAVELLLQLPHPLVVEVA